ncbi:hypothetical protein CCGE532_29580 (plasmid) [Rhizobium sp. CCGE532]|nr:hypothetical protein CCGE532_29580 [Rhizobium sp. CCGE532]
MSAFEHTSLVSLHPSFHRENGRCRFNSSFSATVQLDVSDGVSLPCLDVIAISVSKALLWHTVEARSGNRIYDLACLGEEAARLAADLYSFLNHHLFELIGSDVGHLSEVDTRLQSVVEC